MRWSKLKKLVEESWADSVRGRVKIYSTRYQCSCGRGWLTIDGQEIVDFSTMLSGTRYGAVFHETTNTVCKRHPAVPGAARTPGNLIEPGEFSRFDLHRACWDYLHSSVHDSLHSANPLIVSLAVLHAKVGHNRLKNMLGENLHPLTKVLIRFRLRAGRASTVKV